MQTWLFRLVIPLAIVNALVTVFVLLSPFGIGEGSGVIGYGIVRVAAFVLIQLQIAILGIVVSLIALRRKGAWRLSLASHALVIVATFFLYFDQSRALRLFM